MQTIEEVRAYKLRWYHENKTLSGKPSNQNTDKTHCIHGHEFTEENTIWKGKHRTCKACHREDQKNRARKDKTNPLRWEKLRARRRKGQLKRVGWTPERFDIYWEEQEGRCAICQREVSRETESHHTDKAYADHKHIEPPLPRGILCVNCNLGLGNFQDSPELMKAAIAYVKKHNGGKPSGPQSLSR